jgi:PST family polysaccharide transporter
VAISSSIIFAGLSVQHFALLKRGMEFRKIAVNDMIAAIVSNAIPILLAWWGWGYWALVAKWVISPLMLTVGAWVMCGWRPGLPTWHAGVGPLLRFAFHTYGNFLMGYLRRNIDKMLIGRFYASRSLGLYDRAYHLSSMLPNQIVSPLTSVALSAFSRLSDDPANYRRNYMKVLSIIAFVGFPLSSALALVSNDLVLLILGPQWKEAGKIFFAFGISIGITMIYITHGWLHLSLGTPDRWFRWGIVEFIVTALCFVIALPFGALGVAIAYSGSYYILLGPALWYAGKPIDLKLHSVLSIIWKYFASAFAAGLISWLVLYRSELIFNTLKAFNILFRIGATGALCILIYLIFIAAFYQGRKSISQFISVLREMTTKTFSAKE